MVATNRFILRDREIARQKMLEEKNKIDLVNSPLHYRSSNASCSKCGENIECIDIVRHQNFNIGNIIKYLWRCDLKNGIQDLEKARWYLDDEIKKRKL